MSVYKKISLAQLLSGLISQIPYILILVIARIGEGPLDILLYVGLGCSFIYLNICLATDIVALVNAIIKPREKISCVFKFLFLIWHAINVLISFILIAPFLNPFMLLAVPVVISLCCLFSYIVFLSSNLYFFVSIIKGIIKREIALSGAVITGLIFQFLYVLDIVGLFLINGSIKRQNKKTTVE